MSLDAPSLRYQLCTRLNVPLNSAGANRVQLLAARIASNTLRAAEPIRAETVPLIDTIHTYLAERRAQPPTV